MTHVPDKSNRYVVTFSGGKDSVATWLYLTRELGLLNVTCIFANTGHESDVTYAYLDLLERDYGLPLVRIQPVMEDFRGEMRKEVIRERMGWGPDVDVWSQRLTMERLCALKRRFPGAMSRFCTESLKLRPCARWCKANCDSGTILASGVRAQESASRALKSESLRADRDERAKRNGELLAEIERLRESNLAKDRMISERDAELAARGRVIAKLRGLTRG